MKRSTAKSPLTNDLFEIIEKRRAIRKYKAHNIPRHHLKKILDAARLAPSASNNQPWRFIIVEDKKTKELLAKPSTQSFISEANAIVVVLGDGRGGCCGRSVWTTHDPMIATEHIVLAATALGYGTCWIANYESRPKLWVEEVRKTLKIPDYIDIVVLVAIGIPDETPQPKPRKPLEEICFAETYGKRLELD
ncbi:MAG: nitroreductase family protein [Candidatus Bathyarchaeota archaeon]|nr:nitroreductase family protein [Candidatus Bathyarchaeota archaeon]MDH5787183.1 nitroreductase family protein [Candidatus Bathyarchaeota archaeon]